MEQVTISEQRFTELIKAEEEYFSLIAMIERSKEEVVAYASGEVAEKATTYNLSDKELDERLERFNKLMGGQIK